MVRTKWSTGAPLFASLAQPRDAGIWHKDPATSCVAVEIQPRVAQILPIYTAWSRFLSGDDSEEKSKDGEELCSGKNHCLLVRENELSTVWKIRVIMGTDILSTDGSPLRFTKLYNAIMDSQETTEVMKK